MWLKRNLPAVWNRAGMIFDLADFLTWRATGNLARSICTLTAKWNYLPHTEEGWVRADLERAGLDDLGARAGINEIPVAIGSSLGPLSTRAADELGVAPSAVVAPGMVDAYAGQLALVGNDPAARGQAGLIGGTSSCLMRFSEGPQYLKSFWGPYRDVVLPGWWAIEGGQSATGALLDHIVRTYGNGLEPTPGTHSLVLDRIASMRAVGTTHYGEAASPEGFATPALVVEIQRRAGTLERYEIRVGAPGAAGDDGWYHARRSDLALGFRLGTAVVRALLDYQP